MNLNKVLKKYLLYSVIIVLFVVGISQFFHSDSFIQHFMQNTKEKVSNHFFSGKEVTFKSQLLDESWTEGIETLIIAPIEHSEDIVRKIDSLFANSNYNANNTLAVVNEKSDYTQIFEKHQTKVLVFSGKPFDFILQKNQKKVVISGIKKQNDKYLLNLKTEI
ncbi:hypothetical protein FACS189440_15180 [Bacteroidia bacterium]|nr:hypothetical protein FACS189440_15180 [Bacteroidia bacterium]